MLLAVRSAWDYRRCERWQRSWQTSHSW